MCYMWPISVTGERTRSPFVSQDMEHCLCGTCRGGYVTHTHKKTTRSTDHCTGTEEREREGRKDVVKRKDLEHEEGSYSDRQM